MAHSVETRGEAEERIALEMVLSESMHDALNAAGSQAAPSVVPLLEVRSALSGDIICSVPMNGITTIADVKPQIWNLGRIPIDEQILFSPTSATHLGDMTVLLDNPVIPGYITCARRRLPGVPEEDQPYIEMRDQLPYCTLCMQWYHDGHGASQRHQRHRLRVQLAL
mmetsp:Transcript_80080/g.226665  ORF Transcript_80080/g.226665 Transcript_80080/m.226665 type:complete len:167 (-) Transcript_80080:200-700(-)